ncbi:nicotinate dehydrogenase subunit B [Bradyrhizobium sp. USDA 4524]|uniref:xanthine dehydrogenase family protein molybdopterin-binding subunit n=1 Tax=unclassified Bradyrhizobium TaxID=2631580 RepID=UPI00209CEDB2|nr:MULTISPECIES: molybdopterin cofactor-binding domain-containing protein [unclassified Bradyrhizobium]MCP1843677.1 CO/xanthine dehydrogenase Mo-binding subunit [Bradyrhizobium sp. USDA 4538]MCP1904243.1 CO/xanthine dehydrogenase Mo-binding subunit [Bradyrhizobium sp. USDA 4537]MCP1990101.1 CO/xanthine dehydrogenase Mo-binding subunit [Bradyrhizobium sp. USDA 4539]
MLDVVSTRRDVLKTGGVLLVAFTFAEAALPALAQSGSRRKTVEADEVDGFLSIDADGKVTVYSGKVDLGTGLRTALAQIAAEELDVSLDRVTLIQGDTELTPDQGVTWASLSIQIGGMRIRQAAATARKALVEMAAARFGVPGTELRIEDGIVKASDKSISYAKLVGGSTFSLKVDKDAPVKDPASYAIVGTSVPRLDIPSKATGRFMYMQDFRVAGMLHGRVIRPLAIGARLESVDETSVNGIPGLIKVVREGNFLGVVAATEWGAIQAARKLKATWSNWEGLPEQARLWDYVRSIKVNGDAVVSNIGDAAKASSETSRHISATYDFAIHTHGSIGPSCAAVEIVDRKITCWSASQATHRLRRQLAVMMDVPLDHVHCLYVEGSGCYGRNGHEDAAGDAALLSRAVDGKPVRVQWMRADEHGWDPKGPPILIDLRAGIDDAGRIVGWESELFIPEGGLAPVPLVAATLAGMPTAPIPEPYRFSNPNYLTANSAIPYAFPNVKTVAHLLAEAPFRWAWIRSPGRLQNTFANECFVDEIAALIGVDPLDFRLAHLEDPRAVELLTRLASLSRWEKRSSPQGNPQVDVVAGRGISYAKDLPSPTYVGAVADIEVDRRTGEIRVQRFFVVHDCGQVINPDGVRNQIEGNIIQTLSRTLKEELLFDRSAVTSLHWATYPILTFPEVPDVVIELFDRPTEKPSGAGEAAAAVVPSAISNAVFDALGVRLRSVPFTPAKVLAAIEGSERRPSREL